MKLHRRACLAPACAAAALLLLPVVPGAGEARAQMTMTLQAAGRDDGVSAIIESYEHAILIPEEAVAARAAGRRVHSPFTVRKRVDRATPLLYRAMTASETIPNVRVRVPTSRGRGGEPLNITLTNARIVAIRTGSRPDEEIAHEDISFRYERIAWASADGSVEHTDEWMEAR
jgi:type VI secretion system secreted protein Hcp